MSVLTLPAGTNSRVVDASRRDLSKVSQVSAISGGRVNIAAVTLDGNNLSTLHGISQFPALIQLSVSDNSLVRMEEVCALRNLVSLNLQNNSLLEISGLESLVQLEWLSLAGNSIKAMDGLATNIKITHLDLSDNCISVIGDISVLSQLKTLLLHGNAITSLDGVGKKLPLSLDTFTLAENEIADLNEVFFLSVLSSLRQLSLMSNPCVSLADSAVFDYRPYVCYWCPALKTLDGFPITDTERSYSATLFPSDKPCPFTVGQHRELIHYLYTTCPLHTAHLLTSGTDSSGNTNVQSSIVGVEDVIKSYEHWTADPEQADIIEKLKALQLVEQMIMSQEHILLTQQHNSSNNTEPDPRPSQDHVTTTSVEHCSSPPRPVLNAWAETSPRKSQSPPLARPERPLVTSTDQSTVSSTSTVPGPAADRKTEQLKLLNAKLAQRHSKVVKKSTKSVGDAKETSSSAAKAKKAPSQLSSRKMAPKPSAAVKSVTKAAGSKTNQKSKEKSPKSIVSKRAPTKANNSLPKETTITKPPALPVSQAKANNSFPKETTITEPPSRLHKDSASVNPSKQPLHPTPSKNEPSFRAVKPSSELPSTPPDNDPDLLSSTSYYVPLSEDPLEEATLDSQFEAALEQDSISNSTVLASSLTHAYGLPGSMESSQVLSSLWNHPADLPSSTQGGKEKGETSRRVPIELRGPESMGLGHEQNGNELEECIAQSSIQLQGCRQELAHQSQLLQLQEEILQTLLVEVESLRQWKSATEIRERREAAIVIQKHWRGFKIRKECPIYSNLLKGSATWSLCLSLKKEVAELRSALSALTERVNGSKKVRFEGDSSECHLPPSELEMSHYSISCILLKWVPPPAPSRPDLTVLKCYRVYVNGEVEGMVGHEKCKAYIEGLDRGTTYRITVRALYNTGESEDSNPVVASLNPTKPTTPRSPTDQSRDHSSDEETGGPKKGRYLPPFSPGELSTLEGSSGNRQESTSSQEQQGQTGEGENQPRDEARDMPADDMEHSQIELDLPMIVHRDPVAEQVTRKHESPPKDLPPESPLFHHFQKAKHITIDTVSVLSGCTVEYSPPPPAASTSADTFHGELSLECDKESSDSDDNVSTNDETGVDMRVETSEVVTGNEHTDSLNPPFIADHTKEGVDAPLTSDPGSVPTGSVSFNHGSPRFVQSLPTSVLSLRATEMYTPVSKNFLGIWPVMSHDMMQEDDQILSLGGTQGEQCLMTETHLHSFPLQNGNNVLASAMDVQPIKTLGLFKDNGSVKCDTDIPYTHTNLIATEMCSDQSPVMVSSVISPVTPEISSSVDSHTHTEQPGVLLDNNYQENSKALGGDEDENKELGSNDTDPATVTRDGDTSADKKEEEHIIPESCKSVHLELPVPGAATLPTTDSVSLSSPEHTSGSSSSVELASQLLLELEKNL